ncbi:hypothetical protein PF005_g19139 [Phytophthora fragariae]|uniref:Cysteine protease n=1 Tax=Phytophthora fragariae TaxID=53985 RepID=A0A6A3JCC5_9STRA|nr:hypothetical protein PF003_g3131 [Phytophthora fragariae]KAE8929812.1 hypothetical protein PF009_g20087 [Phytophthora fragariae]KAE8991347.1 hypothetical protein PF011_g17981 [Phytophthora fragariae]KAE9190721.1 hypothetical protein PF005_g19139 [Phytophthora fragariae]
MVHVPPRLPSDDALRLHLGRWLGLHLRSAQMLLGQALQRRLLGRDWRVPALFEAEIDARLPDKYVTLLRWFADLPDVECCGTW